MYRQIIYQVCTLKCLRNKVKVSNKTTLVIRNHYVYWMIDSIALS